MIDATQAEGRATGVMLAGFDTAEELMRKTGKCRPLFIMESSEGKLVTIPSGWGDQKEKEMCILALRVIAIAEDAVWVNMISESWLAQGNPRAPDFILPRNNPKRREVVTSFVAWRAEHAVELKTDMRAIVRDETDGSFRSLAQIEGDTGSLAESWLRTVIQPMSVSQEMRDAAAATLKLLGVMVNPMP